MSVCTQLTCVSLCARACVHVCTRAYVYLPIRYAYLGTASFSKDVTGSASRALRPRTLRDGECQNIRSKIRLICDGQEVELPESAQGVIILNLNSFMGGGRMWDQRVAEGIWWPTSPRALRPSTRQQKQKQGGEWEAGEGASVTVGGTSEASAEVQRPQETTRLPGSIGRDREDEDINNFIGRLGDQSRPEADSGADHPSSGDSNSNFEMDINNFMGRIEEEKTPTSSQGRDIVDINNFMGRVSSSSGEWSGRSPLVVLNEAQDTSEGGSFFVPQVDDGKVEVVAVDGALHLGRILLGMSKPHHVCQASKVQVELDGARTRAVDRGSTAREGGPLIELDGVRTRAVDRGSTAFEGGP